MHIPHKEARRLIQLNEDEALGPEEKVSLTAHLKTCFECRAYAEEIGELKSTLLPVMKRAWDFQPIPLSVADLKVKRKIKAPISNILAIRTAAVSFIFFVFALSVWQLTRAGQQFPGLSPVMVSSVPTPSVESTNTTISPESCSLIPYTVQAHDTLKSIADQFSLPEDEIISINHLETEAIKSGTTLMIPACNFTPTVVVRPTMSTTFTPMIGPVTSSPEPARY